MFHSWKPKRRGRLSTIYLLALTSSTQLLFILKILFSFFTKHAALMRWSTVLILPPQGKKLIIDWPHAP